jgi:outer membrane protein OmpA-like peptidoglycan-associated protein
MKKALLLGTLLCFSAATQAQESTGTNRLQFSEEAAYAAPQGLLPFIGLGGGYTGYENIDAVEGTPATLKLLGSIYPVGTPWVFDIGYGVNNQQFIQGTASTAAITDGVLEFAARYGFANRWQAGVVANQFYNQGQYYAADQADAHFVGIQALKEFDISRAWIARAGVRAMSLTNNTDGLVTMYLVDLQLGWNPQAMRPSARSTAAAEPPTTEMVPTPASDPEAKSAPLRPVTYSEANPQPILGDITMGSLVGASAIEFGSAQAAVSPRDRDRLTRVARVLEENKDLFDKVEVRGYADASGGAGINQRISQQRADQVKAILQRGGLSASDVVASGQGAVESDGVSASDRRAELIFTGVKDEAKLKEVLSQIE